MSRASAATPTAEAVRPDDRAPGRAEHVDHGRGPGDAGRAGGRGVRRTPPAGPRPLLGPGGQSGGTALATSAGAIATGMARAARVTEARSPSAVARAGTAARPRMPAVRPISVTSPSTVANTGAGCSQGRSAPRVRSATPDRCRRRTGHEQRADDHDQHGRATPLWLTAGQDLIATPFVSQPSPISSAGVLGPGGWYRDRWLVPGMILRRDPRSGGCGSSTARRPSRSGRAMPGWGRCAPADADPVHAVGGAGQPRAAGVAAVLQRGQGGERGDQLAPAGSPGRRCRGRVAGRRRPAPSGSPGWPA